MWDQACVRPWAVEPRSLWTLGLRQDGGGRHLVTSQQEVLGGTGTRTKGKSLNVCKRGLVIGITNK